MRINLANAKRPEPVPAGTYMANFTGHKITERNQKGNPTYRLEFTVTEDCGAKGRKVMNWGSLLEESLWSFKADLKTLGAEEDVVDDEDGFDPDEILPELYGAEVIIEVEEVPGRDGMTAVQRIKDPAFA